MSIPLTITRDVNGYPTTSSSAGRKFTDLAQYFSLTQNVVTNVVVPVNNSNRMVAYFSYSVRGDVWVQPGASPTLTIPTGTVSLTTAELLPYAREVVGGQVLQFLSPEAGIAVSISYYAIN